MLTTKVLSAPTTLEIRATCTFPLGGGGGAGGGEGGISGHGWKDAPRLVVLPPTEGIITSARNPQS
eukprot:scaffold665_cov341-Prasinococcus_capsulatus_cf.AAC.17